MNLDIDRLKDQCIRLKKRYPNRCPVVVHKDIRSKSGQKVPNITKSKYMVPYDTQYSQFLFIMRKHIPKIKSSTAIFTHINGKYIPPTSATFGNLFAVHAVKDDDGNPLFLDITYSGENTFG